MNLLIVSNRRTGAYQICKWLQKELSDLYSFGIESPQEKIEYKLIINPYSAENEKHKDDFYKIENSIILLYFEDYTNFNIEKNNFLESYFDFTICLKRKNHKEHAESLMWFLENNTSKKSYNIPKNWLVKYSYELYSLENKLKIQYEQMQEVLGLHIHYEDLFNNDFKKDIYHIVSYIGFIEKFVESEIKTNLKYRKFNKTDLI